MKISYLNISTKTTELNMNLRYLKNSIIYFYKIKCFNTHRMNRFYFPIFEEFYIETINKCNGECNFCPANRNTDTREYKKMSSEMFYDIIAQLKKINYTGAISLFSNNEPLLDSRITDFYDHIKTSLPNARTILYTNGKILNDETFLKLACVVDKIVIDNYQSTLMPNIQNIWDNFKNDYDNIEIVVRNPNEILQTKGSNSQNRKAHTNLFNIASCILPYRQMMIRPNGDVGLCCDTFGELTLGNLNENSIIDIWHNEKYQKIREELMKSRRNVLICKNCDVVISPDYLSS